MSSHAETKHACDGNLYLPYDKVLKEFCSPFIAYSDFEAINLWNNVVAALDGSMGDYFISQIGSMNIATGHVTLYKNPRKVVD